MNERTRGGKKGIKTFGIKEGREKRHKDARKERGNDKRMRRNKKMENRKEKGNV